MPYADRVKKFCSRFGWKRRYIQGIRLLRLRPGDSLLDFGCGTGVGMELAVKLGIKTYGVEPNPELREACNKELSVSSCMGNFFVKNLDGVILSHVVQHLHEPKAELYCLFRRIRYGGRIVLILDGFWFWVFMKPINWLSGYKDDSTIVKMYRVSDISELLRKSGFKVVSYRYSGCRVSWLSFLKFDWLRSKLIICGEKR